MKVKTCKMQSCRTIKKSKLQGDTSLLETGTISCRINNTLQSKCTIWPFSPHIHGWPYKQMKPKGKLLPIIQFFRFCTYKKMHWRRLVPPFNRNSSILPPNRTKQSSQRPGTACRLEPLFLLLLEDLEGVFLAAGSGIRVIPRGGAVLLQGALLVGQLWDAAALPPQLPPSCRRRCVWFGGIQADRAWRFRQAVNLSQTGRLLQALHVLHEDGAVVHQLHGTGLVNAVPSVGGVTVQRHGIFTAPRQAVHQRGGLDQVAFGAVGRQSVADLREWQWGVGIGSV